MTLIKNQLIKNYFARLYFLRIHPLFVVLPLSCWGLFIRAMHRQRFDLWTDELMQIQTMALPFKEFFDLLPRREQVSYMSGDLYLIYPFYRIFGENKWGLAIPHILATVLGFFLVYLICKKYMVSIWGYLIAFVILMFNEELKLHAFEIRPYAVLPTLALASFYFQHLLIIDSVPMPSTKKWLLRLFFFTTILFHAYGILIAFIPTFYFLGVAVRQPAFKQILKGTFRFFFPVMVTAMPVWMFCLLRSEFPVLRVGTFEYTPNPIVDFIGFLKFVFGNLMGYRKFYFLLSGPVLAFVLPHKRRYQFMGFFLVVILLPLTLLFLVDVKTEYWFIQRQFIWVIPFFALFIALCWESVFQFFLNSESNETKIENGLLK